MGPKSLQSLKNLQTKIQKNEQQIHHTQQRCTKIMMTRKVRNLDLRRASARTLISLGGLIEKVGLTDLVGIELGQDLQKDEEGFEASAMLLGALLELKTLWKQEDIEHQKQLWIEKGKRSLA